MDLENMEERSYLTGSKAAEDLLGKLLAEDPPTNMKELNHRMSVLRVIAVHLLACEMLNFTENKCGDEEEFLGQISTMIMKYRRDLVAVKMVDVPK